MAAGTMTAPDRSDGTSWLKRAAMGSRPSNNYGPGEPGRWGEPYELIDFIEGDDEEDRDDGDD